MSLFKNRDLQSQIDALNKSQAVIHFHPDGTVLWANENFLNAMGYTLSEIQGQHHRMFVDPAYATSTEYQKFWEKLRSGAYDSQEYKRLAKGGQEIWIQASYNPIMDHHGRVSKVIKFATDITSRKLEAAKHAGQIEAIGKSQAVIHFNLEGNILWANENFLSTMGYTLKEIEGRHHSMFADAAYAASPEYQQFWQKLRRGEYDSAQYRRLGKGGKEIWIQASYNPIMDMNGKPFMVVKYATDITKEIKRQKERERLSGQINNGLLSVAEGVSYARSQSVSAAGASTETSTTVNAVATAAEEMTSSISEISSTMGQTRSAVDDVIQQTLMADEATKVLSRNAAQMGGVIELIQNIAGQINLLALNATIESARAGEAGRGFAVVASEVKNLANQVAEATTQISNEIEQLQTASNNAVSSLDLIKNSIKTVENSVSTVAGAVEEQTAVTQEISANMQAAADSVRTVDQSLQDIVRFVDEANNAASRVKNDIAEMTAL